MLLITLTAAPTQQQSQHQPILDLFGSDVDSGPMQSHQTTGAQSRASDDLLQLAANPFATPTNSTAPVIPPLPGSWAPAGSSQNGNLLSYFNSVILELQFYFMI